MFDEYEFTLRELREWKGATQKQIASMLGVSQPQYAQMELGKRKPNIDQFYCLANLYRCSIEFVYHAYKRQKIMFYYPDHQIEYSMRHSYSLDTALLVLGMDGKQRTSVTGGVVNAV